MAIINDAYHNLLKNNIPYSPQFSGGGPVPPRPIVDPFYVPGWFEHQDGNWVLVKAGQTWQIQYSDTGGSSSYWTVASYTAGDEDTWFNMDDEPFRMAKYVRRQDSGSTGDNKILAMNLDMPNYLSTGTKGETMSTFFSIWRDSSVINVKIKINHFEDAPLSSTYGNNIFYGNNQMTTCEIEQYNPELMSVTNMSSMFNDCYSLQLIKGLENWNVSNVTGMDGMFSGCHSLQSLDLSNWDVSKVTSMNTMFHYCYSLQSLDLSNWDVSKVTNMQYMFSNFDSLQYIKGIENWDTSNVTNMQYMFRGCHSLQSLDLSNWNTSNVTKISEMFNGCDSLQYIKGIENWNVSNVTGMDGMFSGCHSLQSLDLSNWDVSKVTSMYYMFCDCYSLQSLDLSNWDVSKVTSMQYMFDGCSRSLQDFKIKSKPKTIALTFYISNYTLSNDSLKWMADNFIDISGDDTYTNKTISGFSATIKSRYYWNYFVETMTAKGYTIS